MATSGDEGLLVPPAAALGFAASVGLGALAPADAWWALVVLMVGCSMTATIGPSRAALMVGLLWALCADGFVVHRCGHLLPLGPADLGWLTAFLGAALLGAWCRIPPQLVRRRVERVLGVGAGENRPGTPVP